MSQPKIEFTGEQWAMINKACEMQCTADEVAALLEVSEDTLFRRIQELHDCSFTDYKRRHSGRGKMSLRRKQMDLALNKESVPMLIWLGKQYLNQSDKVEEEIRSSKEQIKVIQIVGEEKQNPFVDADKSST